jgi:hypothetical protein
MFYKTAEENRQQFQTITPCSRQFEWFCVSLFLMREAKLYQESLFWKS